MRRELEPPASVSSSESGPGTVVEVPYGLFRFRVSGAEYIEYLRSLGEKDPSGENFVAFWAKKRADGLADRARHLVRI